MSSDRVSNRVTRAARRAAGAEGAEDEEDEEDDSADHVVASNARRSERIIFCDFLCMTSFTILARSRVPKCTIVISASAMSFEFVRASSERSRCFLAWCVIKPCRLETYAKSSASASIVLTAGSSSAMREMFAIVDEADAKWEMEALDASGIALRRESTRPPITRH